MGFLYTFLTAFAIHFFAVTDIPYATLEAAFASGDAGKIVSYGKDKMIVNVLDKEGVYSQSQASQVLKEFFTKNPASSFKFTFKGKESEEGAFAIGSYVCGGKKIASSYRVTVKWKKIGADLRIESISIENS